MNFTNKLLQVIAFVPGLVTAMEGLFAHRPGADKKDAVMSFLQSALSMSDALGQKEIVDEVQFRQGLSQIISGTVLCFNSSIWASGQNAQMPAAGTSSPAAN
ncbi:MAG: hypothetical protein JOZ80_04160 [Acidobacteriaceae bacterium]|nr:hypothetical protein [Acidobacteriaceae bacterium]